MSDPIVNKLHRMFVEADPDAGLDYEYDDPDPAEDQDCPISGQIADVLAGDVWQSLLDEIRQQFETARQRRETT